MTFLRSKGIFLFLFILPDVILCTKTERPLFVEDYQGNRFYMGHLSGGKRLPEKAVLEIDEALPESFDAREQWPKCKNIIGVIRNQSNCGSCWAFAATEVISDRICINSNGTTQVLISPEDVTTCCRDGVSHGCLGGSEEDALKYWEKNGIVTGGDYNSHVGCRPYTVNDTWNSFNTPPCNKTCEEGYPITYEADKHYGADSYSIKADVQQIQKEIYDNGPVTAAFVVNNDLFGYKSGVYNHTTSSDDVSDHVIKIIGWGVEDNTPYWLCANSWGVNWGDKGFFKILRGNPDYDCNIETCVNAGTPKL